MSDNLSSKYREIPPTAKAYDYDNPAAPFTPESIAAIDSIKGVPIRKRTRSGSAA